MHGMKSRLSAVLAVALTALPLASARAQASNLFPSSATPAVASVTNDSSAVELGVRFTSDVDGDVLGIRFYKGSGNTGTHVGNLWSSTGQLLASATFQNESASGWQEVTFSTPVRITAGITYVASYFAPAGSYAFTDNGLATAVDNAPLHTLVGGNGVFSYGSASSFPSQSYHDANYWVDVSFQPAPPVSLWPDSAVPTVESVTNDFSPVELGVKFTADVEGNVLGIRFYKGAGNTGTHVGNLWSGTGQLLASATFQNESASGWQQVTFSAPVHISAGTTYVASYLAPGGAYAFTEYGLLSAVDSAPLHALADGVSNGNGVFAYGSVSSFPAQNFHAANYWVDVLFRAGAALPPPPPPPSGTSTSLWGASAAPLVTASSDSNSIELGVRFQSDVEGNARGVRFYKGSGNTGPHVGSLWSSAGQLLASATFQSETDSGWQEVTFSTPVHLAANTPYVVSYFAPAGHYSFTSGGLASAVASAPLHTLVGGNGVYAYAPASTFPTQSFQDSNYWVDVVFEPNGTPPPPPPPPSPPPGVIGSGPVLVATDPANHFTDYLPEILKAEGLSTFASTDAGNLGVSVPLDGYKVLVLGEAALTDDQVTLVTHWVNAGGALIALRPAANLNALLGLNPSAGTLSNGYLQLDTSAAPGAGLTADTLQYHGPADLHTLAAGTRAVATLFSNAAIPTQYAAVTLRTVGSGYAAAFAYDIAKSVIYTRQGNPAWQGQNRDGSNIGPGARGEDMFYGNASYDPQPDWVNLDKVQIPQADEQQRLLANLLNLTSAVPLPRLWYFPSSKKAVVVMTGDGHPGNVTAERFQQYLDASPAGCSVADWECVRSTVYNFVGAVDAATAASYEAQGFEYAIHLNTGCSDYSAATLDSQFFTPQLNDFAANYPGVSAPRTNRTHCIAFSDWATQPKVSARHGIRLDTNYYFWPDYWVQDRPGLFTGSGLAMRFADVDGTPIDVYQATTQMTDESGQSYPLHIDTLLANALGPKGYYGAFVANMHVDNQPSTGSDAILASAQREGVSIISARQLLDWLDAREGTRLSGVTFDGTALTFSVATPARNLSLMVPARTALGLVLTGLTVNGAPVTPVTRTIKGVDYAFVDGAPAGTWTATYN